MTVPDEDPPVADPVEVTEAEADPELEAATVATMKVSRAGGCSRPYLCTYELSFQRPSKNSQRPAWRHLHWIRKGWLFVIRPSKHQLHI